MKSIKPDILLIDDNPQNLRLLKAILSEQGYKVRAAINGVLALKTVEALKPDLILLDINMPEPNGYEVCKKLKASRHADIPVIFISALDEVLNKVEAFEVGGVDYISKPFEVQEVLARVKNQLTLYWQQKKLTEQQKQLAEQNAQLQLLLSTTKAINESDDFDSALKTTLHKVCEKISWDFGEFWIPTEDTVLEYGKGWYASDKIVEQFGRQSEQLKFAPNIGLPGQIWSAKQPKWLTDISIECCQEGFRFQLAKEVGLKACFGVPILFNDQVLAVLVFFKKERREPEQQLIELVNALATQLSSLIQRKQAEAALRRVTQQEREKAQQLELALTELQHTQAQLVQNEKMVSLGQLVAGVAHEINNPVSFISCNIEPAREYARDLLHLLELYQQHCPKPVAEITELLARIEPDFIAEDFPKLLVSMQEGANRISEIVLSLKNFSRLDEKECKRVDIHEGIDNTLLILQHRLKHSSHAEIQVIKEYGELPKVECSPGQLNQVFINILTNAIDALEESAVSSQRLMATDNRQIRVRTWTEDSSSKGDSNVPDAITSWVCICIADNGPGMTAKVQSRIFDPFFTTKPLGKGRGLGLSISYQIVVHKHGGQFICNSVPGQGAEFIIKLPVQDSLT